MTISALGTPISIGAHGSFDRQEGMLDLDLSGFPGASGGDSTVRILYLTENGDPVVYTRLPMASARTGGKLWVRIDTQQAGSAAGVDVQKMIGSLGQNPADALALLRSAGNFSAVGKETIGNVETTHYHGTIELGRAAQTNGVPPDLVQRLHALGVGTESPVDAWVDGQGYLRQIKQSYGAGKLLSEEMTTTLSDYGTDVNVTAPPADEVYDATAAAIAGIKAGSSGTIH